MNFLNLEEFFNRKSQDGFTITELIISITIIGILAAIAVPSGLKWIDKEKQTAYISELISYLSLVKKFNPDLGISFSLEKLLNNFHRFVLNSTALGLSIFGR